MEAQGQIQPARECLEKCVQMLEEALGHRHTDLAKALKTLADLLHSQFGKEGMAGVRVLVTIGQ